MNYKRLNLWNDGQVLVEDYQNGRKRIAEYKHPTPATYKRIETLTKQARFNGLSVTLCCGDEGIIFAAIEQEN